MEKTEREKIVSERFNQYLKEKFAICDCDESIREGNPSMNDGSGRYIVDRYNKIEHTIEEDEFIKTIIDRRCEEIITRHKHNQAQSVKFFYNEGSPEYYANIFSLCVYMCKLDN